MVTSPLRLALQSV